MTFVRRTDHTLPGARTAGVDPNRPEEPIGAPDLVLIGCVKGKRGVPSPAKALYVSALFDKERAYAERTGIPWFILSAKHGLVAPDEVLEPYELRLSTTPRDYRRRWAAQVIGQLRDAFGPVTGLNVEIHAGAAYSNAIEEHLRAAGANVVLPLVGLTLGERLRWYGSNAQSQEPPTVSSVSPAGVTDLADSLGHFGDAIRPSEFLATNGEGLRAPGLYSCGSTRTAPERSALGSDTRSHRA